ncbi:W2 domain-containing protein [Meloidogyne graminicola]|uniref:Nuclear pore complex protein Nup98-Nup96 n=1 Tax=Meloidogyne graminicola TaxID=189291 RepID=A0A8S9ZQW1_9BILA|nr:W2 domain-containing protein [Meloidogyne graminicola]
MQVQSSFSKYPPPVAGVGRSSECFFLLHQFIDFFLSLLSIFLIDYIFLNPPTNEEISADGKNNDSCSPPRETDQREDGALEGDNGAVNGYTRGGSGSSDEEENVPEINKMEVLYIGIFKCLDVSNLNSLSLTNMSKMVVDKDLDKSIEDRLDILHLYFQQALNDGTIQDGEKMLNEAERLGLKNKASLLLANVLFTEDLVQQIKIYRDLLLRFCMNDAKAQRHLLGGIEQKVSSKKDVLLPKTAHIIFALYINGICDEEVLISWGKKPSSKYVKKDFVNEMIKVAKPMLKCIEGLFPDTEAEDGLAIAFDDHSRTVGTNVEKKKEKKEGVDNKASTGEYIVEEILGKYGKKYIVKWEGFDETTYECRENLKHLRVFKEFEIYSSCDNYSRAFDRVRRKPGLKALRKIFHINDEDQEEESVECTVQTASRPVADMTIESLPVQRNQKPKLRKQQRKDTVKNVNSTIQTVSRPVADMTFEALPAQRNQKPKLRKQTSKPENESKKKRCETCKNCGELFFTDKVHRCIEKSEFNLTMDSIIITDDDEISQPPSPQQPSASTSLFGAKPADSLFGSNISQPSSFFGQQQQERVVVIDCDDDEISRPPSPPPASTSLFGAKPAGSLFGTNISQPTFFGQQQPGGLFGTTTSAPAFGATTTSISMSSNPVSSFSSFGQPPQQGGGLFGAKPAQPFASFGVNQPIQQFGTASTGTSLFGQQPQTSIGGGLFGSTSIANKPSLFGSTVGTQQPSGLFNTIKFTPPTGTDTIQLKGQQTQVSTKQMCISAMKEFDSKSLEEIRCADYISGKKVSSSAPASTGSLFGKQPQGGLFSTTVSTSGGFFSVPSSTTTASSLFGSQQQTASTSLFGAKPAGSLFGTNISQPSGGIFGQPQPGSSVFAMGGNKSTSAFTTQPTFFIQQQPGGLFGTTTPSALAFGATTTSPSMFTNHVSTAGSKMKPKVRNSRPLSGIPGPLPEFQALVRNSRTVAGIPGPCPEFQDLKKLKCHKFWLDKKLYLKIRAVVAIYFSAMWCPSCRAFTPKLKKFYEELKAAGKNFEVIFVSRDRSANDMKEHYNEHHGAWPFFNFGHHKLNDLLIKYDAKHIPTCRVIKPDGTVVIEDARTEIQERGVDNALALWDEWMGKYNA